MAEKVAAEKVDLVETIVELWIVISHSRGYFVTIPNRDQHRATARQLITDSGYKSPEEVYDQTMQAKKSGWDDCEKWYKAERYVQLAEDQTPPEDIGKSENMMRLIAIQPDGTAWRKVQVK